MQTENSGTCLQCKQEVQFRTAIKHLNKCLEKNTKENVSDKEKIFLVRVHDRVKLFWLFVEINGSSALELLDSFLRDIWLECCGHMSEFSINGERYSNDGEMRKKIHRVFNVGDKFDYAYDFGTTTELKGEIISLRPGKLSNNVRLLARNNMPSNVKCTTCGKQPEVICSECYDFCCTQCKTKHNSCKGEEFLLPVVNSPRMGVCGYTGENYFVVEYT